MAEKEMDRKYTLEEIKGFLYGKQDIEIDLEKLLKQLESMNLNEKNIWLLNIFPDIEDNIRKEHINMFKFAMMNITLQSFSMKSSSIQEQMSEIIQGLHNEIVAYIQQSDMNKEGKSKILTILEEYQHLLVQTANLCVNQITPEERLLLLECADLRSKYRKESDKSKQREYETKFQNIASKIEEVPFRLIEVISKDNDYQDFSSSLAEICARMCLTKKDFASSVIIGHVKQVIDYKAQQAQQPQISEIEEMLATLKAQFSSQQQEEMNEQQIEGQEQVSSEHQEASLSRGTSQKVDDRAEETGRQKKVTTNPQVESTFAGFDQSQQKEVGGGGIFPQ